MEAEMPEFSNLGKLIARSVALQTLLSATFHLEPAQAKDLSESAQQLLLKSPLLADIPDSVAARQPAQLVQEAPQQCIRKAGCKCPECSLWQPQATKLCPEVDFGQPESVAEWFLRQSLDGQFDWIQHNADMFRRVFAAICLQVTSLNARIVKQEKFLQAVKMIALDAAYQRCFLKLLVKTGVYLHLVLISWGYSDNMRWRAIQIVVNYALLCDESGSLRSSFKYPLDDILSRQLSDKLYCQAYNIEKWYDECRKITPDTEVLDLSLE